MAITIFLFFVAVVLGISFFLGAKAKSAKGFFAAGGGVPWWVNGVAFAGDYLSAASFLGICGMIAFYGYDGFLYSIGYLAGWVVALFVIAEPLKRLGRFTFADALDSRFDSRGIKLAAAISTLVVSTFYLIPQMVGAGALIKPLLGWEHWQGVCAVGGVVIVIVATAGMVSTTWVQFIKGGLLVLLCTVLTIMILARGLTTVPAEGQHRFRTAPAAEVAAPGAEVLPESDGWVGKPYVRIKAADGTIAVWRKAGPKGHEGDELSETQTVAVTADKKTITNGKEGGKLLPVGQLATLPDGQKSTGALGPLEFFRVFSDSTVVQWVKEKEKISAGGDDTVVYYQKISPGATILTAGGSPTFAGLRSDKTMAKVDFLSLMLALFLGTASLPHILIRYYTVKDQVSARKSTILGIASIGFFYVLTLYLGLGAMTSGTLPLDPSGTNMAAPLLAKSFNEFLFAVISAVAFTTVLGTVSGLIMAASGAVAHDLATSFLKLDMSDGRQVRIAKIAAVVVGLVAIALGILFKDLNATFLVAWAFNIAASANLPALVMLLFWSGTTKQGITWGIVVGLLASLGWVLGSKEALQFVYGFTPADAALKALVPFSQPAIVTIPLGFLVLVVVSLLTRRTGTAAAIAGRKSALV
jgi:cation/acetate symporter